jgi:hypothetical protein
LGNQKDFLGNYLSLFSFSFFLKKKKQKFKTKDQLQSFLPSKSQRRATRKIVCPACWPKAYYALSCSLSPKAAALLPTYDKCVIKSYCFLTLENQQKFKMPAENQILLQNYQWLLV